MSESALLLQLRPPGRQLSSTLNINQMCRQRTALPSASHRHLRAEFHGPSFPPGHLHALLGCLPRRHLHPDQTSNPILNLDESINRLSSEMSTLQDRLDHLEQERLEAVTSHRMQSPLATKTEHCTAESEDPNHGQSTWSCSLKSIRVSSSPFYRHNLFTFVIFV